jgi:hypothetical protein
MDKSKLLIELDIMNCANELHLEPACIKAVIEVESNGCGFLSNGDPKILFEGHLFYAELKKRGINPEQFIKGNEDILYKSWTKKFYKGGIKEYSRLYRAKMIHEEAALRSASWGMFQILASNCRACGYTNANTFVAAMYTHERNHLTAFCNLVKYNGWLKYLQDKDWKGFATHWNGPKQDQGTSDLTDDYSYKLEQAFNKFKNLKR